MTTAPDPAPPPIPEAVTDSGLRASVEPPEEDADSTSDALSSGWSWRLIDDHRLDEASAARALLDRCEPAISPDAVHESAARPLDGVDEDRTGGIEPLAAAESRFPVAQDAEPAEAGGVASEVESALARDAERPDSGVVDRESPGHREEDGDDTDRDDTEPRPAPSAENPLAAWAVLGRALKPRATRAQVLAGVLCGVLGFAVVVQVRQTHDEGLSTLRQSELVGILDQTTRQGDELQREATALERTRQKLLTGSTSSQAALDAATNSAAMHAILTGRLPAEGPGIVITITEAEGAVRARTLLNLLEELRNAGAEAIQLNDQRLTASSYIMAVNDQVVVDGASVAAPYRWLVIGDPDTMATALEIPGGAFASVRNDKGRPSVARQDLVEIAAIRVVPTPRYATPASEGGG